MYICICAAVTESEIRNAIYNGAKDIEDIRNATDACTSCGMCECAVQTILESCIEHT